MPENLIDFAAWSDAAVADRGKIAKHSRDFLRGQLRPWRMIMGYSKYDPAMQAHPAWNEGKMVGTKRPLTQKQIWAVRFFLEHEGRLRDRALFDLPIDSKLRGCDLVKIKIGDVVSGAEIRTRSIVIQQKTGRPVQFEPTADVRRAYRRGWTVAVVRSTIMFFQAVPTTLDISARDNMRDWSMNGS